jgi:hypothetical protein
MAISLKYKDGVEISINPHYSTAKKNAEALKIPFRNQNVIQLANEYLKIYTDGDEWKSVFNKQASDMILGYKVGIDMYFQLGRVYCRRLCISPSVTLGAG